MITCLSNPNESTLKNIVHLMLLKFLEEASEKCACTEMSNA